MMRCPVVLSILALILASSATALASSLPPGEVAVLQRPEARTQHPVETVPPRPTDLFIIALTGGPVFIPGRGVGGFGRGGSETLFSQRADGTGPLYGVTSAWEGYSAPASNGFSFVAGWTAGFATKRLLVTVGLETNVFTFDTLNKATGFGLLSPRANARLGVRAGSLAFAATAEMQYRWRWGIEDQRDFSLGLSLLYTADSSAHR